MRSQSTEEAEVTRGTRDRFHPLFLSPIPPTRARRVLGQLSTRLCRPIPISETRGDDERQRDRDGGAAPIAARAQTGKALPVRSVHAHDAFLVRGADTHLQLGR
jgi:hypothetical protein